MRRRTRTGVPYIEQARRDDTHMDVLWKRLYPCGWTSIKTMARGVSDREAERQAREIAEFYETRRR